MRESMVFYGSFASAIKRLPESEQLKALWAIIDYGLYDEEPSGDGLFLIPFDVARPVMDANRQRREGARKGGRPQSKSGASDAETIGFETESQNENHRFPETETIGFETESQNETYGSQNEKPNINVNVNINENKKENTLKGVKEKRFAPPTREEVAAYCAEKGYKVDADRFVDFYESKGWYVGKNKMKNWQAAVRNWARGDKQDMAADPSQRQDMAAKGNKFHNFEQRDTDYNTLVLDRLRQRLDEAKGG